ncbi:uncharacterized protein LOC127852953 [Dreissena polymorpha]|uniref:Sushi domain-containing protein n=1 Tax=Dreissena polymorpha TaxID=45954 RepID=A0A9D4HSS0_DREPO|nr:uncharacterized protein LOC127852953 [Dreissena polymorpha]KAH3730014.1 hypothetical protein DPMN_055993 [Dreissena polymorpha]
MTNPWSGKVTLSTNGQVTKATYSCNSGYTLTGVTDRTCLADGNWDGTESTCSEVSTSVSTTESTESHNEKINSALLAATVAVSSVLGVVVVAVIVVLVLYIRRRHGNSARETSAYTESIPQHVYVNRAAEQNPDDHDYLQMTTPKQLGQI